MIFNKADYDILRALSFRPDYPGFRPDVYEAPNRDGKADTTKLYSHISHAYKHPIGTAQHYLDRAVKMANDIACAIASAAGVPEWYLPCPKASALRVLWYPPNTGGVPHTDVDLLTVALYRNTPVPYHTTSPSFWHWGQLGVDLGYATEAMMHSIDPSPEEQYSIVYAANPPLATKMPAGSAETVGDVLKRYVRAQRVKAEDHDKKLEEPEKKQEHDKRLEELKGQERLYLFTIFHKDGTTTQTRAIADSPDGWVRHHMHPGIDHIDWERA